MLYKQFSIIIMIMLHLVINPREGSNLEQGERFGIVPDIQVDEQSMREF